MIEKSGQKTKVLARNKISIQCSVTLIWFRSQVNATYGLKAEVKERVPIFRLCLSPVSEQYIDSKINWCDASFWTSFASYAIVSDRRTTTEKSKTDQ